MLGATTSHSPIKNFNSLRNFQNLPRLQVSSSGNRLYHGSGDSAYHRGRWQDLSQKRGQGHSALRRHTGGWFQVLSPVFGPIILHSTATNSYELKDSTPRLTARFLSKLESALVRLSKVSLPANTSTPHSSFNHSNHFTLNNWPRDYPSNKLNSCRLG